MNTPDGPEIKPYIPYTDVGDVLDAEYDHIRNRKGRENRARGDLAGLALSGGGIRSAVFSLGVMQALAHHDLMKRFDYLSTASGGGYIGSSLTWFLSQDSNLFGTDREAFPFGYRRRRPEDNDGDRRKRAAVIRYLRMARQFLFAGQGITPFSILGVVARGALVNLAVFVTLLVGVMAGWKGLASVEAVERLVGFVPWTDDLGFALALAMLAAFAAASVLYVAATPILIRKRNTRSYSIRWSIEVAATVGGTIAVLGVVMGALPLLDELLKDLQVRLHTPGGLTVTGLLLSALTFLRSESRTILKAPVSVVGGLAAGLLLFGLLVGAYVVADLASGYPLWIAGACAVAVLIGLWAKVNLLTVHRYYRDRLMETFLPNLESVFAEKRGPATDANTFGIVEACPNGEIDAPYHLVNTHVLLNDSSITKYRSRGGDNFILSPLYCGSRATGWQSSETFMRGGLTLATAMAISGAAVTPGAGPMRNPMIAALMSLLNLQLGYWVPNPLKRPTMRPNVLVPGSWGIVRALKRMDEQRNYVQIGDGGFFENLALYELIRRKVRLVVVVDGAADPNYTFGDFGNLQEKARVDFGAQIDIDLEALTPQVENDRLSDRRFSKQGFAFGTIAYNDGSTGCLLYVNTTLVDGLPEDVYAYADTDPTFPDQTTADQFFDEKQFEAYRELGYHLCDRAIEALRVTSGEREDEGETREVEAKRDLWKGLNLESRG